VIALIVLEAYTFKKVNVMSFLASRHLGYKNFYATNLVMIVAARHLKTGKREI
jgi:hypothetical protein